MTDDGEPDDEALSVVESWPAADTPPVHGVVLAAGTSSRFGERNKLLEPVDGELIVRRATRPFVDADVHGVTVVLGYDTERVGAALNDLPVAFVENPDYEEGQSTSVRVGVRAAQRTGAAAVAIGLGDMPNVDAATVDALVSAYGAGVGSALASAYRGQRGNPVLFDSKHFEALSSISGDAGGRSILLGADEAALVETGDPGVTRDIDRPADL